MAKTRYSQADYMQQQNDRMWQQIAAQNEFVGKALALIEKQSAQIMVLKGHADYAPETPAAIDGPPAPDTDLQTDLTQLVDRAAPPVDPLAPADDDEDDAA